MGQPLTHYRKRNEDAPIVEVVIGLQKTREIERDRENRQVGKILRDQEGRIRENKIKTLTKEKEKQNTLNRDKA